jgi:hypothetical protein
MRQILIFMFLLPNVLFAQGMKIFVSTDNNPFAYASFTLSNNKYLITNQNGIAYIDAPKTYPFIIKVSCVGYISIIDTILSYTDVYNIRLKNISIELQEINAIGYTDKYLTLYITSLLKNIIINDKLFETYISETFTIEDNEKIIERLRSTQIYCFENMKLNDIKFKSGAIALNAENINEQFRSEAISRIQLITNPMYSGKNPEKLFTLFSFLHFDPMLILKYFSISYTKSNQDMQIILKHKLGKYAMSVFLNKEKNQINEVKQQWLITEKYPLTTTHPSSIIQDTILLISNIYFKETVMQGQSIVYEINYKTHSEINKIRTYTYSFKDSNHQYLPPVCYLPTFNDYVKIISIPSEINNIYYNIDNSTNTYLDSLFDANYKLVKTTDVLNNFGYDNELISDLFEKISLISHWKIDWTLKWERLNKFDYLKYSNTNAIKIYFWADYKRTKDSIKFIVEPLFDYNASYYQDIRNDNAKMLIELLMHHAKYLSLKLRNELESKFYNYISHDEFNHIVSGYQKQLEKDIFLYKSKSNFGKDTDSLNELRKEILGNLQRLL